ncbi:hypothetical protein MHYP_G00290930 [Metynnis hypsauchen]
MYHQVLISKEMASDFYARCSGITSTLFKEESLHKDSGLREEKRGGKDCSKPGGKQTTFRDEESHDQLGCSNGEKPVQHQQRLCWGSFSI